MEFLAAPLLWGLAAMGIPILLHMTGRSRPTVHRFPAMRFILLSQRASSRALKIKHLIILLLRMFLLALIAWMLARPLLGNSSGLALLLLSGITLIGLAGLAFYTREFLVGILAIFGLMALQQSYPQSSAISDRIKGDYVFVLDRSMSMSCVEVSGTRFEFARQQALKLLESLSAESRVALIFAGDTPQRTQARLSVRHDLVKQALLSAEPNAGSAQLDAALSVAREIIQRDTRIGLPPASIILFTDMQRTTLNTLMQETNLPRSENEPPLIVVDVIPNPAYKSNSPALPTPPPDTPNGSVLHLHLPAKVVTSDSPVTVTATLQPLNPTRRSLVELFLDDRRVEQKYIEPNGKNSVETSFTINAGAPGSHALRLHLAEPDTLSLDQNAYLAFVSGRPARALIIDGPMGARRTSFFLKAAIQPIKNAEKTGEIETLNISGLDYDVLPLQQFNPTLLNNYKLLILADCGDLAETDWDSLERWTDEGGGLFVWAGPNTNAAILRRRGFLEVSRNKGLLPATIEDIFTPQKTLTVVASHAEHPLLAHFTPGVMSVLRETQIFKLLKLSLDARDTDSTVVLSSSEGHPVLTEKSYGRGRVILSALDPGLDYSDLPRRAEAFVTLTINALRLLTEQDAELKAKLGLPLKVSIQNPPADRRIVWTKPDGSAPIDLRCENTNVTEKNESTTHTKPPSREQNSVAALTLPPIDKLGIHRLSWMTNTDENTQSFTRFFEVNAEARESDLTRASNENIQQLLNPKQTTIVCNIFDAPTLRATTRDVGMREFSTLLMILLLGLLLLETFFSNRLYRTVESAEKSMSASAAQEISTATASSSASSPDPSPSPEGRA